MRVTAGVLACLAATLPATAQTDSLRALLRNHRCAVVDRLEQIYEFPKPTDFRDRFLAVTLASHPHGYVQCMFVHERTGLLCEASSGYFYDPPKRPRTFRLSPSAVAELGRLGFSTDDADGNFRYEATIIPPPDFNAIADLILTALHNGYGARAGDVLRFNAPFAARPTSKCIPPD